MVLLIGIRHSLGVGASDSCRVEAKGASQREWFMVAPNGRDVEKMPE